jgi:hypothetical protein
MKAKPIKSSDKMKKIEKKYGIDFGSDSLKKVGKWLKEKGYNSLAELIDKKE